MDNIQPQDIKEIPFPRPYMKLLNEHMKRIISQEQLELLIIKLTVDDGSIETLRYRSLPTEPIHSSQKVINIWQEQLYLAINHNKICMERLRQYQKLLIEHGLKDYVYKLNKVIDTFSGKSYPEDDKEMAY